MRNITNITPFLHVNDLESALAFFNVLGFEAVIHAERYAYVQREAAAIRIVENETPQPVYESENGDGPYAFYIDVRDVDELYAELKPKFDRLPAGKMHGPRNSAYGQRELVLNAPDGSLMAFGQSGR